MLAIGLHHLLIQAMYMAVTAEYTNALYKLSCMCVHGFTVELYAS